MTTLGYILVFSLIGSMISMVGGFVVLSRSGLAEKVSRLAAPFAAGALLGTAFLDLLPEAAQGRGPATVGWALVGMLVFFFLERFVHEFHHQHTHTHDEEEHGNKATVPMVIIGDLLHNSIDGVVIAGTFLVSVPLGVATTIAVSMHEIPQEIGDFGLLLHRGLDRRRVVVYNVLSALATVVAALITYGVGVRVLQVLPVFLAVTAGFFIYIAASDLIPELHRHRRLGTAGRLDPFIMLGGIALIWVTVLLLE
ncbi:MAG: ZIP family metal transporter [Thermoanaerobaculia bacterium]|nr:ZIP family metal transporter [Thermoanaerobaculia bacterium]